MDPKNIMKIKEIYGVVSTKSTVSEIPSWMTSLLSSAIAERTTKVTKTIWIWYVIPTIIGNPIYT